MGKMDTNIYRQRRNEFTKFLTKWCQEAGVNTPMGYDYSISEKTLTVFTDRPGLLIGKAGAIIEKYKEKCQEIRPGCTIKIKEIRGGFANY